MADECVATRVPALDVEAAFQLTPSPPQLNHKRRIVECFAAENERGGCGSGFHRAVFEDLCSRAHGRVLDFVVLVVQVHRMAYLEFSEEGLLCVRVVAAAAVVPVDNVPVLDGAQGRHARVKSSRKFSISQPSSLLWRRISS